MNATSQAARRNTSPTELAFATHFGLAPHLAKLLAELFDGETVTTFRTRICALRSALEPEAIDTTPAGYRLTDDGRAECEHALAEFQRWVVGRAVA